MTGDSKAPSKMSPASQGHLEVEKYIGSCLISHSTRGKNKNKKPSGNAKPEGAGNNGSSSYKSEKKPAVGVQCPVHSVTPYASLLPICDRTCGGYKFNARSNYGNRSCGWAGMPLISMANSRRNKKTPCLQRVGKSPPHPSSSPPPQQLPKNRRDSPGEVYNKGPPLNRRSPLTHLAIHTQGAPLILAGRGGNRKNNQRADGLSPARLLRGGDLVLPHAKNGKKDAGDGSGYKDGGKQTQCRDKDNVDESGKDGPSSATGAPSDCMSVASDESSGHSENSLPRIIKPRKRRKKDRKPSKPAGEASAGDCESSTIVTLQPYVPLCYDLDNQNGRSETEKVHEEQSSILDADKDPEATTDLEDSGIRASLGIPTTYPYPPSSLCQCRYCDPEGLIWDVDQHCYSPFLTPPLSPSDLSFSKSPFASIPLFLSPPPDIMKGFEFSDSFLENMLDSDSYSHLHMELRRSKSEPPGRIAEFENACDKLQNRSQGLEVSTEIITSPNGHRDIEIKFYSPPTRSDDKTVKEKTIDVSGAGVSVDGKGEGTNERDDGS